MSINHNLLKALPQCSVMCRHVSGLFGGGDALWEEEEDTKISQDIPSAPKKKDRLKQNCLIGAAYREGWCNGAQ